MGPQIRKREKGLGGRLKNKQTQGPGRSESFCLCHVISLITLRFGATCQTL